MSYRHVCEPCREALGLPAEKSYLSRMRRRSGGFSSTGKTSWQPPEVVQRDASGKPLLTSRAGAGYTVVSPTSCVCNCSANGHDPHACTGEDDFVIGGRPGSGAVDAQAAKFGIEPTAEMVASLHEEVAATVRVAIAWLKGADDEERLAIENELDGPTVRYSDQLIQLRDLLIEKMPVQAASDPYRNLKANLKKLADFRNSRVAHTWPIGGDWLTRARRENGQWVTFTLTADEVATHMDLAFALLSQLAFIPNYVLDPANDDPEAAQRLRNAIEREEGS